MLTMDQVLRFIKRNLAFPFQVLELQDEEIQEYVVENTLQEFSHYYPDKLGRLYIDVTRDKVPQFTGGNHFFIVDPDGREILRANEVVFPTPPEVTFGHPLFGPFSQYELREWGLQVETSKNIKIFSSFDYQLEFTHPNILRVSPRPTTNFTVIYDRIHASDLSSIPNAVEHLFRKLALADIKIIIGQMRRRFSGNLRSPFGEIPISDHILDEGKEEKREVLEKLDREFVPTVFLDIG